MPISVELEVRLLEDDDEDDTYDDAPDVPVGPADAEAVGSDLLLDFLGFLDLLLVLDLVLSLVSDELSVLRGAGVVYDGVLELKPIGPAETAVVQSSRDL